MLAQQAAALFAAGHSPYWLCVSPKSPLFGQMTERTIIDSAMAVLDLIRCENCGWLIKRKAGPLCDECRL